MIANTPRPPTMRRHKPPACSTMAASCAPDRRHALAGILAAGLAPVFLRHAHGADVPRFALGVASGHPGADHVVLWTRLTGAPLPAQVPVRWELAHDERFVRIAARGTETAERDWAHSVHAEPRGLAAGRSYFYRFHALGATSAVGRTRTAPAPDAHVDSLAFAIASCQRFDAGHYAAWRDAAEQPLDLVLFLGDYIYESASPPDAVRRYDGERPVTLEGYRQRYATTKADPHLQAAHAAAPWLTIWDDHEVDNDYAGLLGESLQSGFRQQRAAAYQAYWEHLPFPNAMRPVGTEMRITGRLDWGRLARLHLLDARQYRDPQACPRPGGGGSNTVEIDRCPELLDPRRSLLGGEQERWLEAGWDLSRPWNLLAQTTLMARFAWPGAAPASRRVWTDGWEGYAPSRQRLLAGVARRRVPGVVVLGGDVHAHYVADLHADFDHPAASPLATEFCGTSISSPSLAQARIDAALPLNPHLRHARSDRRGYVRFKLEPRQLHAQLMAVDDVLDPLSPVRTAASFVVEQHRPGARPA